MKRITVSVSLLAALAAGGCGGEGPGTPPPQPALTVQATTAEERELAMTLDTAGPLHAWQEVSIGSEVTGYRIKEVLVDVGDQVRQGQVLARLDDTLLQADVAQAAAALAEAEANLKEAKSNAERARTLLERGAISTQDADQQITAAATAAARVQSSQAQLTTAQQRLQYASIVASDNGVISERTVSPGQLAAGGVDLFKFIRRNRIEWRAEIPEGQMGKIKVGMTATVLRADGTLAKGRVRAVSPSLDPNTRRGVAYVDLTIEPALRPGMFVTGSIEMGRQMASTLPLSAVSVRDGFSYVFVLQPGDKVSQRRVTVGRILTDSVEISEGLAAGEQVVLTGAGFLRDGDHVRVSEGPAQPEPAAEALSEAQAS